ncbi:hypothetical protein ANMWB30_24990 [Arthrobacter sp. MWB30]|nr:hypothetical protein ANMWB30_24990 [Arthrobacter sp. MWB30]
MRERLLDEAVTELMFARMDRSDFLVNFGGRGLDNETERQEILNEIDGYNNYLERVRQEAAEQCRFDLLLDQESRIAPKIKDAQKRLEELVDIDPLALKLAAEKDIRGAWAALPLQEKRRVIRSVVTVRIHPVTRKMKGKRGINYERIEPVWH